MSNNKLVQMLGLLLAVSLLAGCSGAPTARTLKVGDTFTLDSFTVKLVQVVEWPEVVTLSSKSMNTVAPKQADNTWLIVTLELQNKGSATATNIGKLTSALALSTNDASVIDSAGQTYNLTRAGTVIPEGKLLRLFLIREQTPTTCISMGEVTSGRVFVNPIGTDKLAVTVGDAPIMSGSVLGDPAGPKWYVGIAKESESAGKSAQFSLLFEVPKNATGMKLKFLSSSLVKLPEPVKEPLPVKKSSELGVVSMTYPYSTMCKAADDLLGVPCR